MELIAVSIPFDFIREITRLSWREVLFGLDNGLLEPGESVDIAATQLAVDEISDPALVQLASLGREEATRPYVEPLANTEPEEDVEEVRNKWLYLVLTWIYEHKELLTDPLQRVEEVYADFDYPECIACFVRYMPSDEPDLGSPVLNEQRLFRKWRQYLEEASRKYASPGSNSQAGCTE